MIIFTYIILYISAIHIVLADQPVKYSSAVLRTCSGWKLSRLPEVFTLILFIKVREFIINDARKYNPTVDVEFSGGDPRMIFLDDEETELKTE
jgi:hypothetical protein